MNNFLTLRDYAFLAQAAYRDLSGLYTRPAETALVIDYARQEVPLGGGAADRVAIVNGMGGAIERITVGSETLSYAQFVGRYAATARSGVDALPSNRRRWQDGRTKVGAGNTAANSIGRMAA